MNVTRDVITDLWPLYRRWRGQRRQPCAGRAVPPAAPGFRAATSDKRGRSVASGRGAVVAGRRRGAGTAEDEAAAARLGSGRASGCSTWPCSSAASPSGASSPTRRGMCRRELHHHRRDRRGVLDRRAGPPHLVATKGVSIDIRASLIQAAGGVRLPTEPRPSGSGRSHERSDGRLNRHSGIFSTTPRFSSSPRAHRAARAQRDELLVRRHRQREDAAVRQLLARQQLARRRVPRRQVAAAAAAPGRR